MNVEEFSTTENSSTRQTNSIPQWIPFIDSSKHDYSNSARAVHTHSV